MAKSEVDIAIERINNTRGLSSADKRELRKIVREAANKSGDLGAGDRKTISAAVRERRGGGKKAEGGGGKGDGGKEETRVSINPVPEPEPKPDGPPGQAPDGYQWIKGPTGWYMAPIPGYKSQQQQDYERQSASQFLSDLFVRYGIAEDASQFATEISNLIREYGTDEAILSIKIKETNAYKERFKYNLARPGNGYNMLTEAEYLAAEDAIKTEMRAFGLTDAFMNRDYIGELIGMDVSAAEVSERINEAAKVIDNADPMVMSELRRLYGMSVSDMYSYVLDAERALPDIERRANAALAAGIAVNNDLSLGVDLAERIGYDSQGNTSLMKAELGAAAQVVESTERLAQLENVNDLAQDAIIEGEMGYNEKAQKRVRKLASKERARFSGMSGIDSGTLGGNSNY